LYLWARGQAGFTFFAHIKEEMKAARLGDCESDDGVAKNFVSTLGTHWTVVNARTLADWLYMGAYQIRILDEAIVHARSLIRASAILTIILSTATGTLSVSTLGAKGDTFPMVANGFFILLSFTVAVMSGGIKVLQIQERLEECIGKRQDWVAFVSVLTSELQLPLELRRDALYLIVKYKDTYVSLLKRDADVSTRTRQRVEREMAALAESGSGRRAYSTLADFVLSVQGSVLEKLEHELSPETQTIVQDAADATDATVPKIDSPTAPDAVCVDLK